MLRLIRRSDLALAAGICSSLSAILPAEVVTNSADYQKFVAAMPSGIAWAGAGFFIALWLFYQWDEKSRAQIAWDWLTGSFTVERLVVGQFSNEGVPCGASDLQIRLFIRFKTTKRLKLRLRLHELVGRGKASWESVIDLGDVEAVSGAKHCIEIADLAFPFAEWDHEKKRGWGPTKDRPVIGNSLNIAVVECQARFFTQRHKFFLAHINHDTGSGLFKPSIYVQDQDEDIWDASPNNLLGSWREKR